MSKLRTTLDDRQIFKCPCGNYHSLRTRPAPSPSWEWNGGADKPTFSSSILSTCTWTEDDGSKTDEICHSVVRDGMIQFLSDCTHALAGQTVEIPEWPHAPGTFGGIKE